MERVFNKERSQASRKAEGNKVCNVAAKFAMGKRRWTHDARYLMIGSRVSSSSVGPSAATIHKETSEETQRNETRSRREREYRLGQREEEHECLHAQQGGV